MRKGLTEGMDKQKFQEAKQARIEIEYFKKGNEHGHEQRGIHDLYHRIGKLY